MTTAHAQWLTLGFVLTVTVGVLAYDFLIIRAFGPDASISRVMARLFFRSPVLTALALFWLGLLVGHLLLPAR
jgi:hypothetical protein